MTDKKFKVLVENGDGCAVIMAGSGSDDKAEEGKPSHIGKIVEALEAYQIPYEVRVCSGHKQPGALVDMIKEYNNLDGPLAIIAVAGGTDGLSGIASYHSLHPVISCPPDAPNYSCIFNLPGSSNAYVQEPSNVGKLVAQMFSYCNPRYKWTLVRKNCSKIKSLEEDDENIQRKYCQRMEQQGGE